MEKKRIAELKPIYVKTIPEPVEAGILYISLEYKTTIHSCACGCGEEIVLPISDRMWQMSERNGKVSLSPSIGSFSLPCQSHYHITANEVVWC